MTKLWNQALRWVRARADDVVDIFVYVVVLNLAVEYLPAVISEGFTLSLLTAVLLKFALELVLIVKGRLASRFHGARTAAGKVGAGLALWAAAVGSKFAVLELVNLLFGDAVSLGGFLSVTLLILALLLSRAAVRKLLLSEPGPAAPARRPSAPRAASA